MANNDRTGSNSAGQHDKEASKSGPLVSVTVGEDALGLGRAAESPAARTIAVAIKNALSAVSEPARTYLSRRAQDKGRSKALVERAKAERKIAAVAADIEELKARTAQRLFATELRRQENIEAATAIAIEYAEQDASKSAARELDDDWITQWMDGVKDISSPELRSIWARLLLHQSLQNDLYVPTAAVNLLKTLDSRMAQRFGAFAVFFTVYGCYPDIPELKGAEYGLPLNEQEEGMLEELGFLRKGRVDGYHFSEFYVRTTADMRSSLPQIGLTYRAYSLVEAIYGGEALTGNYFSQAAPSPDEQSRVIAAILSSLYRRRVPPSRRSRLVVDLKGKGGHLVISSRGPTERVPEGARSVEDLAERASRRLQDALAIMKQALAVEIYE